jgi:hypothetical protein
MSAKDQGAQKFWREHDMCLGVPTLSYVEWYQNNFYGLLLGKASAQIDSWAPFWFPEVGFLKRTITWSNFGFSKNLKQQNHLD